MIYKYIIINDDNKKLLDVFDTNNIRLFHLTKYNVNNKKIIFHENNRIQTIFKVNKFNQLHSSNPNIPALIYYDTTSQKILNKEYHQNGKLHRLNDASKPTSIAYIYDIYHNLINKHNRCHLHNIQVNKKLKTFQTFKHFLNSNPNLNDIILNSNHDNILIKNFCKTQLQQDTNI